MTAAEYGHCRHCGPLCPWGAHVYNHRSPSGLATWKAGQCTACAEAERIAKWCDERAGRVLSERSTYYDDRGDRAAIYERVAEYARGDR